MKKIELIIIVLIFIILYPNLEHIYRYLVIWLNGGNIEFIGDILIIKILAIITGIVLIITYDKISHKKYCLKKYFYLIYCIEFILIYNFYLEIYSDYSLEYFLYNKILLVDFIDIGQGFLFSLGGVILLNFLIKYNYHQTKHENNI